MARQVRAERTRQALIAAAATEFNQHGYAGTSLARISKAAGVTMGALTFHFPTKGDLADAVGAEGETVTRAALSHLTAKAKPGLQAVVELTLELARLLEADVTVLASARLAQERTGDLASWHSAWTAILRDLLKRVAADGGLESDARDIELLAVYLMAGAEASIRTGRQDGTVCEQLSCLWALAFTGAGAASRNQAPALSRDDHVRNVLNHGRCTCARFASPG